MLVLGDIVVQVWKEILKVLEKQLLLIEIPFHLFRNGQKFSNKDSKRFWIVDQTVPPWNPLNAFRKGVL